MTSVYQMPPSGQDIGPAEKFDFFNWWSDEAVNMVPLLAKDESRTLMVSVAKHLRWIAAAERNGGAA